MYTIPRAYIHCICFSPVDVFSEKNLNRMAREIQVNDFTSLGSELGFSEAEVQCFREDCHRDHRQAVFKMLLAARYNRFVLSGSATV